MSNDFVISLRNCILRYLRSLILATYKGAEEKLSESIWTENIRVLMFDVFAALHIYKSITV